MYAAPEPPADDEQPLAQDDGPQEQHALAPHADADADADAADEPAHGEPAPQAHEEAAPVEPARAAAAISAEALPSPTEPVPGPASVAPPAFPHLPTAPAAPPLAALQSHAPSSPAFSTSPRASTPPALSSRIEAAQARLVAAVPPKWLEVARQRPVLWMVGVPVVLASLLVLPLIALEPPRRAEVARPEPSAGTLVPALPAAPAAEHAPAPAREQTNEAKLAELEGKAPSTLSVDELLQLSDGRAVRKRQDAAALARKLEDQPDTAKDPAVQAELWRLASDPDTAHVALGAMAQSRSSVGADLLYEVWMSRSMPAGTAELARTLLYSRDVRPMASPALAAALELRAAESCEAMQKALPHAERDGDRRSLPSLGKLNARRGCGAKKADDCYPCLRKEMKQVTAAINGSKKRPPPTYAR